MSQSRQPQRGHRLLVRVFGRGCGPGGAHSEYRGSVWLLLFLLSVYLWP